MLARAAVLSFVAVFAVDVARVWVWIPEAKAVPTFRTADLD